MDSHMLGWTLLALAIGLGLCSALRFDLLRALWRDWLLHDSTPPRAADAPPQGGSRPHAVAAAAHPAAPRKPGFHRSGRRGPG
jgi:hypothetical protein